MTLACSPCNLLRWVWNDTVNWLATDFALFWRVPQQPMPCLQWHPAGPVGTQAHWKCITFWNHHFLKFSQESQELSFNLNLKEDVVEGSVGVTTFSGVLLAIISLHLIPILYPHVLRDFRVPRTELFSTHCCHYDSACQSRHEEAWTSRSQDTEAGCWWYDLTSSIWFTTSPDTTHLSCPSCVLLISSIQWFSKCVLRMPAC